MKRLPAFVTVPLHELRLNEEFETSVRHETGRVIDWGHVVDVCQRTGRQTRVRACLCRFGTVERVFSAELLVLVAFDRPHARMPKDDASRWDTLLREPFTPGKVRAEEVKRFGLHRAALEEA